MGKMLASVGAGLLQVKSTAPDVPPPGVGLKTVTENVPAACMSAALICAINCVALTNVVVRSLPLKRTSEALTKLVPLTVITSAPFPAMLFGGESVLIDGAALLTVKVTALELPPPGAGLKTVITGVPATATSVAVIRALDWEEWITVVLWSLPWKRTSEL